MNQGYPDSILVAWASAYLAAGGRQDKARESLLSRGDPWPEILAAKSSKPSVWKPRISRLTTAARNAGALPKALLPRKKRQLIQVAQPVVDAGNVLLPGVIRDCMSAGEVLSRLTGYARGTAPEVMALGEGKEVARARIVLDALAQLVKVLGIEPPPQSVEDSTDVQRARLRQRLAKLPADVLAQVREAFGDEEGV